VTLWWSGNLITVLALSGSRNGLELYYLWYQIHASEVESGNIAKTKTYTHYQQLKHITEPLYVHQWWTEVWIWYNKIFFQRLKSMTLPSDKWRPIDDASVHVHTESSLPWSFTSTFKFNVLGRPRKPYMCTTHSNGLNGHSVVDQEMSPLYKVSDPLAWTHIIRFLVWYISSCFRADYSVTNMLKEPRLSLPFLEWQEHVDWIIIAKRNSTSENNSYQIKLQRRKFCVSIKSITQY